MNAMAPFSRAPLNLTIALFEVLPSWLQRSVRSLTSWCAWRARESLDWTRDVTPMRPPRTQWPVRLDLFSSFGCFSDRSPPCSCCSPSSLLLPPLLILVESPPLSLQSPSGCRTAPWRMLHVFCTSAYLFLNADVTVVANRKRGQNFAACCGCYFKWCMRGGCRCWCCSSMEAISKDTVHTPLRFFLPLGPHLSRLQRCPNSAFLRSKMMLLLLFLLHRLPLRTNDTGEGRELRWWIGGTIDGALARLISIYPSMYIAPAKRLVRLIELNCLDERATLTTLSTGSLQVSFWQLSWAADRRSPLEIFVAVSDQSSPIHQENQTPRERTPHPKYV